MAIKCTLFRTIVWQWMVQGVKRIWNKCEVRAGWFGGMCLLAHRFSLKSNLIWLDTKSHLLSQLCIRITKNQIGDQVLRRQLERLRYWMLYVVPLLNLLQITGRLSKNSMLSSWGFQLFLQKAYVAGCPSMCGMVSDQGEKSLFPQFFALKNKVGRML